MSDVTPEEHTAIIRGELMDDLLDTLEGVNRQLDNLKKIAEKMDSEPGDLMDSSGRLIMNDLLVAKANVLHGLVVLSTVS